MANDDKLYKAADLSEDQNEARLVQRSCSHCFSLYETDEFTSQFCPNCVKARSEELALVKKTQENQLKLQEAQLKLQDTNLDFIKAQTDAINIANKANLTDEELAQRADIQVKKDELYIKDSESSIAYRKWQKEEYVTFTRIHNEEFLSLKRQEAKILQSIAESLAIIAHK